MIAVEPNGNVMAAWVQWDEYGTSYHIYANRYVVGSGWGSPNLLETSDLAVYKPRIAADSNGNAIAVWQQTWTTFGERFSIYANRYVAGTGWGAATAVYEDKKDWLSATGAPRIAVDQNGNAMAVWSLNDSTWSHTSVWASRYVVGTGWSSATNLSGDVVQSAYGADVALDSIGNAIVVWYQASGTSNSVAGMYADRYTVGTGWGTPVHIGTSEGSWAAPGPRIAVDPSQRGTPPANQASLQIGMWPGQAGALPKPLLIQAARAILRMSRLHVTRMEMPSLFGIIMGANFTQTGM